MQNILLDFRFDNWRVILLTFFPALINLGIFLYVFLFLKRNRTNTAFFIFLFLIGLWQVGEGLARISISSIDALGWYRISGGPSLMMLPFGFLFAIRFANIHKKIVDLFLLVFLFLPAIIFELCLIARVDKYVIVKSELWNWIINPELSRINIIMYYWMSFIALLMLGIFWRYYFKHRTKGKERTKALLLAFGFTLPTLGGIIAEVISPLVFHINSVPLTTPLLTIFSICSLIAITKYEMLEYSPKYQWDQIVESMNEGILIVDNEDRIMYANESFCKLLGYEFNELKGEIAKEIFLDEEEKKKMTKVMEDRKIKIKSQYEMPLKTKEGKVLWMLISGSPYYDKNGKIIGSISVQTDITNLKENEIIRIQNETRLKQAQEVAQVGSWEINFISNKANWSDEACRIYGLSSEEKENQSFGSWFSYIHPDDLNAVKKEIERSQSALSNSSFKHRIVLKNGDIRHVHSVSRFDFNSAGFPIGLFGVCHDITQQIEAEKALSESEANMKTFINESLLSIYFVDPISKKVIYANSSFSELLGYSQEESEQITAYDFINHSKENIDERMLEVIQLKKINNGERQWKRKDGKIIYVLVSSFCHKRNGKDFIYVAAQNITERKMAEEKLRGTNLELETFIYKASHDLRGPLASIIGLVNISKLDLKESKLYFDMIGTATQKLDYTLGELVKAMQIKEAKIFSDQIDFNKLTDDALKKFTHFPGYDKLKIYTDIAVNELFISNKTIVETIVQNLIENAIKYQRTNCKEPFLKIHISGNEKNIELTIEDNGIGIEEPLQSQVYDMYFRGNATTKGSGLGLYLVKKGVDKLKGEIQLKSKPEIGTVFTILLPN